jgi:Spy/CpxP family protein refolding chaperone
MIALRKPAVVIAALATVALGTAAAIAETATSTTPAATTTAGHPHWHHGRGGFMVGVLLRATHQLNLTTEQREQIHSLLANARSAQKTAAAGAAIDLTVIGNPGHANFAAAVQDAQSRLTQRIQSESELATSIYNVLSDAQKQQLPQVLAQMQSKMQARRAAWQQRNAAGTPGAGG